MAQWKHLAAVLLPLCLILPPTSPRSVDVHICDKDADYAVSVSGVDISPFPVSRATNTTFAISASTGKSISGGKIKIDVSYFGFHVHNESHDLCEDLICPLPVGDFVMSHSLELPILIPPGSYTLKMTMEDENQKQLMCITFYFRYDCGSIGFQRLKQHIHHCFLLFFITIMDALKEVERQGSWLVPESFNHQTLYINKVMRKKKKESHLKPPLQPENKSMRPEILSNPKYISDPTWKLGFFTPNDGCMSISKTPDITEAKMSLRRSEKVEEKIEDVSADEEIKSMVSLDPPSLEIDTSQVSGFKDWCGKQVLVLYTTSLRGIRKTFDDCSRVRFLLESFRVMYSERDVSMHMDYRNELWRILGGRVIPPRLFVRGRYVGGANEVVGLHEKGMLRCLLQGIPVSPSSTCQCDRCGGMRFVVCDRCSGSRKVAVDVGSIMCGECNENGLVKCLVCC